jgi:hypothetical protein
VQLDAVERVGLKGSQVEHAFTLAWNIWTRTPEQIAAVAQYLRNVGAKVGRKQLLFLLIVRLLVSLENILLPASCQVKCCCNEQCKRDGRIICEALLFDRVGDVLHSNILMLCTHYIEHTGNPNSA